MTQTNDPPLISSIDLIPDAAEKADLDAPNTSGGKLVVGQAPNITITETNVVADADERLALDVQEGDIAIQTNVSTSFIFTGGDNVANNWETLDFDAVGAIDGEDINPRDITPRDITATGDISLQDLTVAGAINGADTSAAGAGEALTSDGSGGFSFASVGGIETASTFSNLPTPSPPQIGYVQDEEEYYSTTPLTGAVFDISEKSNTVSISRKESGTIDDIALNNDGTKFYEVNTNKNKIYQYTLSTPFEIQTNTFESDFQLTNGTGPSGIDFKPDGTSMVLTMNGGNTFSQYDLSTPFDVTTATFTDDFPCDDGNPRGVAWSNDGTLLHEINFDNDKVIQYTLSTPFDITTATLDHRKDSESSKPRGIAFGDEGNILLEIEQATIFQLSLSTPFDVSTATLVRQINSEEGDTFGAKYDNRGRRLYESGAHNNIYQHTLSTGGWDLL